MFHLAYNYMGQKRFNEAEKLARTCLTLCVELKWDDLDEIYRTGKHLLALILAGQGHLEQSKQVYESMLAYYPTWNPGSSDEELETAWKSKRQLVNLDFYIDKFDDTSTRAFETIVDTCRRSHGEESLVTANAMLKLAIVYNEQGRHAEAEDKMRRSLAINQAVFGKPHEDCASMMAYLGRICGQQGRHEEALDILAESLAIFRQALGATHPDTVLCLENMTIELMELGRLNEAHAIFSELSATLRATSNEENPGAAPRGVKLNLISRMMEDLEESLGLKQDRNSIEERVPSPEGGKVKLAQEM